MIFKHDDDNDDDNGSGNVAVFTWKTIKLCIGGQEDINISGNKRKVTERRVGFQTAIYCHLETCVHICPCLNSTASQFYSFSAEQLMSPKGNLELVKR